MPDLHSPLPESIEGVVDVEILRGPEADPTATPGFLVEVPHGADRRHHYDALRARLSDALPAELEVFFCMNTDVGAWAYGRATAERLIASDPTRSALLLRSRIPRTFIDCNRPAAFEGGDVSKGGLTAGIPAYVTDPADRALLVDLHQQYVACAGAAFAAVCGAGGQALVPHTYGPRTVGIESVGDDIVSQLRWAHEPERYATWDLRAEVDLLTRDAAGTLYAPQGVEEALLDAFTTAGFAAVANETYQLLPQTLGYGWSTRWRGQVTCLEVRRDLLVPEWRWDEEMLPDPGKVDAVARVLADVLHTRLG